MRDNTQKAIDTIDSALYTGDEFFDKEARETFQAKLTAWQLAMVKWEELVKECEELEEGGRLC